MTCTSADCLLWETARSDVAMCRETRYLLSSRGRFLVWAFVFMCIGSLITIFVVSIDRSLVCHKLSAPIPHLPRIVSTSVQPSLVSVAQTNASPASVAVTDEWPPLNLDYEANTDILTFIHIQKTGGSDFLSHIVTARHKRSDLRLCYPPSDYLRKRVRKKREFLVCSLRPPRRSKKTTLALPEMWLVSEKTFGWICGLHPYLSEMKTCLPAFLNDNFGYKQRRFNFFTILRHPVVRFLSEYMHVRRGATWAYGHQCGGKMITEKQVPACYDGYYKGKSWKSVSLQNFMDCPHNWAMNRQTVMLADLEAAGCFNTSHINSKHREQLLLNSAKRNLEKISFFGLSEYMVESEQLFEHRFNVKFDVPCKQKKIDYLHSAPLLHQVWNNSTLYNRIAELNNLDMELYNHALKIFSRRLKTSLGFQIDTEKLSKQVQGLGVSASVSYLKRYYNLKEKGVLT